MATSNIFKRFEIDDLENYPQLEPDYNVAPGKFMPVVTRNSPNKITIMKWGLIPSWAKDPKIGYRMINARADSIAVKPSFRAPFKKHRCLVPASGFYEWKQLPDKKIPYYIKLKNDGLFAFAGLYDIWKDAEGKEIFSYTIITTSADDLMKPIHDRMPVILAKSEEDLWLDNSSSVEDLEKLLDPYPAKEMEVYEVSSNVNNPRNNSEELIKRVD